MAVHPHTRGEHCGLRFPSLLGNGSSPHPWGTLLPSFRLSPRRRFIPTPVGNTKSSRSKTSGRPVHPHTRGEHIAARSPLAAKIGSSPHPWGTHGYYSTIVTWLRFIPTPVGNTATDGATTGVNRFIPTPVGNTRCSATHRQHGAVHPHTRGEHRFSDRQVHL